MTTTTTTTNSEVTAAFARAGLRVPSATEISLIEREQREAVAEAERAKTLELRVTRWARVCPLRYREAFDFAKCHPAANREELQRVLNYKFSDRGLYIVGETGRSKSRAVGAALARLAIEEGRSVTYLDGIAFANGAGAAFSDPQSAERWLRELCKPDVLWIDDLAKRWTPATEEAAFAVVERRTANALPLVITNNYGRAEMMALAHDALVVGPMLRRLKDYCDVIET